MFIFEYTHQIIKLMFNFLNLYQHAKNMQKISSFHQIIFEIYIADFRVPWSKRWHPVFDYNHPKISNSKDDWTSIKYLNVLHHNRTQMQLQYCFLIYWKNITNFLFWILWTDLATFIKNDNANFWKLWCLSACKKCR